MTTLPWFFSPYALCALRFACFHNLRSSLILLRGPPSREVVQSFTGMISSYLSNCPSSLSRSTINCQPQSVSLSTSHFPFEDPPQGPLSRLFAHRAIGQIPPVICNTHSPHP